MSILQLVLDKSWTPSIDDCFPYLQHEDDSPEITLCFNCSFALSDFSNRNSVRILCDSLSLRSSDLRVALSRFSVKF